MDRNSIIGILLIVAIFILWGVLNKPDQEQLERTRRYNDSIALVQQLALEQKQAEIKAQIDTTNSTQLGDSAVNTKKEFYTLENELISAKIASLGGRPYSVQLKEYQTWDSLPLILFNGNSTVFELNYYYNGRSEKTGLLNFAAMDSAKLLTVKETPRSLTLRYTYGAGEYLDFIYTLAPNSYQLDMEIKMTGLQNLSPVNGTEIDLRWEIYSPQQERSFKNEALYSTVYYKPLNDDVDFMPMRQKKGLQEESILTQVDWIAYKDQFFSSVLIPGKAFSSATMQSIPMDENSGYIKQFKSVAGINITNSNDESIPFSFYFGPNKYKYLKKNYADKQLHDLVSVGRGIIKWINQGVIINIFHYLEKSIGNYGIIILLLTIIIKLLLLPLTFRSYISTAKMRVVKPMVDEATSKIPKEKAMERQQATMAIYRKVGVSPFGGCLPMVLQMPILFAMFRFFPGSIELRQEAFLWATDLSTYDDLIRWGTSIPLLGNHLSIFTVLMTITTIMTMKMSGAQMQESSMPGMKTMMYIMPVTFLFFLNDFSSGLTYYYFLANVITFGQNYLFKAFVNEEEVLKKLQAKKANPRKKSRWQLKLEEMQKMQQQQAKKRK